jgi:Tol biopolymer transport system component
MHPDADDPWLLDLGAAVSDGKAIDWDAALRSAPDAGRRQLVEQMRRVADLAAAHGEQPSGRWRHLLLFEKIGEGAFGAVYRGWDPQLERDVAVKLLSSSGGDGTSPIDEARHLARVRHRNIVTVHGADRDAGQTGLWMEYLKGQTLDAMVRASGPMSAREATAVALDLSHALSALHGAGLLHRDIKAANVMREVGGRIVLMDFSGAHAKTRGGDADRFSGTPLFMAPELFVGGTATPASDVYSLGVLLFYLLTGALPVTGGSLEELKGAHTSGARKRLRDLRPDLPDAIVQVIERMTAADPARRLQTAGEVEAALVAASGLQDRAAAPPRRLVLWPVAVAAIALLAALLSFYPHASADVLPHVSFIVGPPYMSNGWPRLSPQGTLAFGTFVEGRDRFWVRPLDAFEGHVLSGTTATETPFWSPDGRTLAFFADGKLKKIRIDGGDPLTITDAQGPHGGDWSDNWILFATDAGIFRMAPDGSARAQVTTVDPAQADRQHAWPELLPDGKHFLYVLRSNKPERAGLYFAAIDGSEQRRLMEAYSRTAYSAGHILFVREGTLQAVPFDAARGVISGQPVALAPHVKFHPHTDAAFDATPGGILAYAADAGLATTRLVLFDRRGRELRVVAPPAQTYRQPRFSPDGLRVVAEKGDPNETQTDLWIYDLARGRQTRFATGTDHNVNPAWSPNGDRIAFSKRIDGQFTIVSQAVDRTAPEQRLASLGGDTLLEDWSRDGKYLTATLRRSGLWVIPLDPKRKPWLVRGDARPDMWQSEISPDSRWIAYTEEVAGRPEVFVEPLLSRGPRWQISTQGGGEPHWRGDSGELFYLTPDGALMSMDVNAGDWQHGSPVQHFRMLVAEIGGKLDYTLSPDAQQIVVNVFVADPAALPISVIVNWPALLRGR